MYEPKATVNFRNWGSASARRLVFQATCKASEVKLRVTLPV